MGLVYKYPKVYNFIAENFSGLCGNSEIQDLVDKAINFDNIQDHAVVLDLACGSGIVGIQLARSKPNWEIIGVDISASMIQEAQATIAAAGLKNMRAIHMSALDLTPQKIEELTSGRHRAFDVVICSHGFSVMGDLVGPIFQHTLSLLKPGGRYAIMDIYYPESYRQDIFTKKLYEWFFGSNQLNPLWELLEHELDTFVKYEETFRFGGIYYVAGGDKRQFGDQPGFGGSSPEGGTTPDQQAA